MLKTQITFKIFKKILIIHSKKCIKIEYKAVHILFPKLPEHILLIGLCCFSVILMILIDQNVVFSDIIITPTDKKVRANDNGVFIVLFHTWNNKEGNVCNQY